MRVTIEWERANRPAPAEATDQLNATRLDYAADAAALTKHAQPQR